jgi:hypothetical protein
MSEGATMFAMRFLMVALVSIITASAAAQAPAETRPYDGIQAGMDAFRLAEEQRQNNMTQQLGLNDTMRFANGYPTSRRETIYYGYMNPAVAHTHGYAPQNSLDAAYGYGYRQPWYLTRPGPGLPSVFEPWPYVPGDLWGYGAYYAPARQPIGQQQLEMGPNHWESHPVYDPPLTLHRPLPPVDSPWLDRTPYAAPAEAATLPQTATPPAQSGPVVREWIPPEPPNATRQGIAVPPGPAAPTAPQKRREY